MAAVKVAAGAPVVMVEMTPAIGDGVRRLAVLAIAMGVISLLATLGERRQRSFPATTLIGFILTGLAAVGYGSFIVVWGLGPF